jgi:glycosyltransferase involved in cell wall biosynthesis
MDAKMLRPSIQSASCCNRERPDTSRMTGQPLFTVITASLNNARTIATALESVKNQTYRDVEHIVIDGGSADETREVLKHYETQYHMRWISAPDRGLADAMNKGVHVAQGSYVIFIHADDALNGPTIMDSVAGHLVAEQHDICSFPILFKHPRKGIIRSSPIKLCWYHRFRNTIRHQGCFVHRRLYERVGGFNHRFSIAMDYDFFYRAFQSGASIRYFDQPVTLMGGEGVSSDPLFLLKRLKEEHLIQDLNEANRFWRTAQKAFRSLYVPYKTRRLRRQLKGPQA